MKAVIYSVATRRIIYEIDASEPQIAAQVIQGELGVALGAGSAGSHWVPFADIEPRPGTGLPATAQVAVGVTWAVPAIPAGTVAIVDGAELGMVPANGLEVRFDYPGEYLVELRPPFPWLGGVCEVEVTS